MAYLSDMGYLSQPHTSAGRIPSQTGYRYYVDNLMTAYELGIDEQERIKIWLQSFSGEPDKLLEKAGSILAELTDCVAVSSSPADADAIKRAEENEVIILGTAKNSYEIAVEISKLI